MIEDMFNDDKCQFCEGYYADLYVTYDPAGIKKMLACSDCLNRDMNAAINQGDLVVREDNGKPEEASQEDLQRSESGSEEEPDGTDSIDSHGEGSVHKVPQTLTNSIPEVWKKLTTSLACVLCGQNFGIDLASANKHEDTYGGHNVEYQYPNGDWVHYIEH